MAAQGEGRREGHEQGLLLLYLRTAPSSQNKKLTRLNTISVLNEDKTHGVRIEKY